MAGGDGQVRGECGGTSDRSGESATSARATRLVIGVVQVAAGELAIQGAGGVVPVDRIALADGESSDGRGVLIESAAGVDVVVEDRKDVVRAGAQAYGHR